MTPMNTSEVFYLVAPFDDADELPTVDSFRVAGLGVRALERYGSSIEYADWRLAGEVKAAGHFISERRSWHRSLGALSVRHRNLFRRTVKRRRP